MKRFGNVLSRVMFVGLWSRVVVAFSYELWWQLVKSCAGVWSRVVVALGQELWWLFVNACGGLSSNVVVTFG